MTLTLKIHLQNHYIIKMFKKKPQMQQQKSLLGLAFSLPGLASKFGDMDLVDQALIGLDPTSNAKCTSYIGWTTLPMVDDDPKTLATFASDLSLKL